MSGRARGRRSRGLGFGALSRCVLMLLPLLACGCVRELDGTGSVKINMINKTDQAITVYYDQEDPIGSGSASQTHDNVDLGRSKTLLMFERDFTIHFSVLYHGMSKQFSDEVHDGDDFTVTPELFGIAN